MTKLNPQIKADPANINILPGYSDDPRIVENLLNGVNRTRDDFNMWLAPFEAGKEHTITVTFKSSTRLALFRLWNYNKSRWVRTRIKRLHVISGSGIACFLGSTGRNKKSNEIIIYLKLVTSRDQL